MNARKILLGNFFALALLLRPGWAGEKPFLTSELLFPAEHWHCHASCIVESPK